MYRKILYFVMAASLTLQGCSDGPKEEWLVGSWAPMEESCGGADYYNFEATGQFSNIFYEEGIWKLSDETLILTTTSQFDEDKMEIQSVNDPPWELTITSHDKNTFSAVGGDGSAINWMRCSFDDGEDVASGADIPSEQDASDGANVSTSDDILIYDAIWDDGVSVSGTCYAKVSGTVYMDGACSGAGHGGSVFTTAEADGCSFDIDLKGQQASGIFFSYKNVCGDLEDEVPVGPFRKKGQCWVASNARFCLSPSAG